MTIFLVMYNNRYNYDFYDRIWSPCELSSDWRRLSTSLNNDDQVHNKYNLPAVVMSTAVTPVNASVPLQFHWDADNVSDQFQVFLHFKEVEKLDGNETRAFNITSNFKVNGLMMHSIFRKENTILCGKSLTGATRYHISLSKTENSTRPPILNAFEIYMEKDISQSETDKDDGKLAL